MRTAGRKNVVRQGRTREAGFTLIEILVTLVIVSFGLVAVLGAFQRSVTATAQARDVLRASQLIAERMAEIQAAVATGGGAPSSGRGRCETPDEAFVWEQEVREETVPDTIAKDDMARRHRWYTVRLTVSREGDRVRGHTVETLIAVPEFRHPR